MRLRAHLWFRRRVGRRRRLWRGRRRPKASAYCPLCAATNRRRRSRGRRARRSCCPPACAPVCPVCVPAPPGVFLPEGIRFLSRRRVASALPTPAPLCRHRHPLGGPFVARLAVALSSASHVRLVELCCTPTVEYTLDWLWIDLRWSEVGKPPQCWMKRRCWLPQRGFVRCRH